MAGSLFDQLKKAGLVDEKKGKQLKKQQHQQLKQGKKHSDAASEAARLAAEAAREKQARDRELNQARQAQLAAKAEQAALRQMIEANALADWEGDVEHHFVDGGKIKKLLVTRPIHAQLAAGTLRIARHAGGYTLITAATAEKIAQRDEGVLIPLADAGESISSEDQAHYARFEVPDDLMW